MTDTDKDKIIARLRAVDVKAWRAWHLAEPEISIEEPLLYQEAISAAELYEIVKDVPREAWPEHVWYFPPITCNDAEVMNSGGAWRERPYGQFINDATAHNAFVGSMTVWLAFHNWFPKSHIWRDGARVMLADGTTHKAPSLVAALVAAVAAARKEDK